MPANLRIVPKNFHDEASLVTQVAPVSGFSINRTQDSIRGSVWRSTDGADQYVGGYVTDGLPRTTSFFGFFGHRCHGGGVRLVLYTDNAYSTIAYDSGVLPIINVVPSDGLDWGVNPYGTGAIDPFITEAPFWLWHTATPWQSYRIYFSGNSGTYGYSYWQVCRFVLGPTFELAYNPDYGMTLGWVDQTDRNRSRGGSLRTNVGPAWREFTADVKYLIEADRAKWLDVMRYLGTGRDFVISLFPGEATRRERDNMMLCKFKSLSPLTRQHLSYLSNRIQVEEV